MKKYSELFEIKINPDRELVIFARYFANNYSKLKIGKHKSKKGKYVIEFSNEDVAGVKVSKTTGEIVIDKEYFKKIKPTPDVVFFLIMWCIVQHQFDDYFLADKITIEYISKTKWSKKNIAVGIIEFLNNAPTELNNERIKKALKILKQKQNGK